MSNELLETTIRKCGIKATQEALVANYGEFQALRDGHLDLEEFEVLILAELIRGKEDVQKIE